MVKAIFFDWFNTLACYEPPREELHSQLLRDFGIEVSPAELMPGLLLADKYIFAATARSPVHKRAPEEQAEVYARYADIMLSEVGVKADRELILRIIGRWPELMSQVHFVLFDDVLATFKTLKERKLVLGLLTNASRDAVSICRKLGLEPYLDFVVTSEEAKADKPDSAIFLLALERAGVGASEAIHVGDQYDLDVVGARGVGISPVMIDRYDLYPEVSDCPRICSLTELDQYL